MPLSMHALLTRYLNNLKWTPLLKEIFTTAEGETDSELCEVKMYRLSLMLMIQSFIF